MDLACNSLAIACHNISKRFGSTIALDQAELAVPNQGVHAILGENGAGKSTLLRILAGLERADQGEISIHGVSLASANVGTARRLGIGLIPQHISLFPQLTVLENIVLHQDDDTKCWRISNSTRKSIASALSHLGLSVNLDQRVSDLSFSLKKQLELFRILHSNASILLLDEPTATLGPQAADSFLDQVRQLAISGACTALLVTHKLPEVRHFASSVSVFRAGRLVLSGPTAAFTDQELVQAMIGHS